MKHVTKTVLLFCLTLALMAASTWAFGQGTVSGNVADKDGEGLYGAVVQIQGTSTGAVTDFDGNYSLEVPTGEVTLEASYVGFSNQEAIVNVADGQRATVDFAMSADALSLDEVVVTGTFSGRSQKNSPISMTVLNAAQLSAVTFNSQADVLRAIPGITAEGGGGEVASNIFVRGMPSGGQYQFTPLQVDGLPTISTFGLNSSAHDVYFRNDIGIRNLEFVRGGASTLFGAGSVAGIINYSSATGSDVQSNKIGLEWSEMGRIKADFFTSGPLADNLYYAFTGFYRHDEGPLESGLTTRGYQVRGNIKKLYNDGRSSFTVYGQAIDDNVQFYLPYPLANNNGDFERPDGNDGETIFTLLTGEASDFSFETPNGRFETPIENGVSTKGGYLMADLKHSFENDWRLQSKVKVASYDHWFNLFLDGDGTHNVPEIQSEYLSDRGLPADAEFSYVDNGRTLGSSDLLFQNRVLDRRRPMEEMVGEFNLTKSIETDGVEHNITIGTYLSNTQAGDDNWIWNYVGDYSNAPRMVNISYVDPGTLETVDFSTGGFISGNQTANRYHQSFKSAIYIADEIKGEKFNFDIGLRWERAVGNIKRETGVGSNTFQKGNVDASDFAIALAGLYKMNDNVNLYANASKGYFFPELRGVSFSSPGEPQSYETEKIYQGEIGAKIGQSNFSATAAAFLTVLQDRRSVDFVNDGQGGVREEVAVQSTRTIGIEATARYFVTDDFALSGDLTFQNHEFTEVEGNSEQEGNWLRRQPQVKATVGAQYDKNKFDFSAYATITGKRYANDANTAELDGFTVVNANLGYTFDLGTNESFRLGLAAFNLLDAQGITEGSPRQGNAQTGSSDYFVGRPILPRRITVRALFSF